MATFLNRIPRTALISSGVSLFLLAALAVGLVANRVAERTVPHILPGIDNVEFTLQSAAGPVTNRDLLGRPVALFFGFTHCPEICPTTLYSLTDMIEEIGPEAADIQVVFVTVDPERDTPGILARYVGAMSDTALGLSGEAETVNAVLKEFGIYFAKVPLGDGDYTMDHTATVFLYDGSGALAGTIAWDEPAGFALEKLRRLAAAVTGRAPADGA